MPPFSVEIASGDACSIDYRKEAKVKENVIPNIVGMSGMDAVALLGNMGLKVQVIGVGKVKKQSLKPGEVVFKNQTIILELS